MTIKQALKEKSKLAKQISEAFQKISTYNSCNVEETRAYDAKEAYTTWIELTNKLIELKTNIHKANSKVYDKIFRLSELKSIVKQLSRLDCAEGKKISHYEKNATVFTAQISIVDRDKAVKEFEAEIETLQEELDTHNLKTKI